MKCTAHRSNGEPCNNWAVRGATVCRNHGGSAPQVRAKAVARLQEQELDRRAAKLAGVNPDEILDPIAALRELVKRVVRWEQLLSGLVAQTAGEQKTSAEVIAMVTMWERAMDRAAGLLVAVERLGPEKWYGKEGIPQTLLDAEIARLEAELNNGDPDASY